MDGEVDVTVFQNTLLAWYRENARSLPWREISDPYAIWVSEVMLQQTQVSKVIPYHAEFMKRFPTVEILAKSSESDVLHSWQGLGYYRRARHLHQAAQQVVEAFGGRLPSDLQSLQSLPGVGRYMAGAIRSFAFNKPAPIVEANTGRLLARLFGIEGRLSEIQRPLWDRAELLLNEAQPGDHNQALTELGALVCLPKARCTVCPVAKQCRALELQHVDRIPTPQKRPKTVELFHAAGLVRHRGKVLMVQIPEDQWWGGMWELPRVEVKTGDVPEKVLGEYLREQLGVHTGESQLLARLNHSVTQHRIELSCYGFELAGGRQRRRKMSGAMWCTPAQLDELALSAPQTKLLKKVTLLLENRLTL